MCLSLVLNAQANYGHVRNGKAYHLGGHIQVNGHILLVITHIQCFDVPMFQCFGIEQKLKGLDCCFNLGCFKIENVFGN